MEIVTHESEQLLVEMLGILQQHPERWIALQIPLARLHHSMIEQEGLSRETLNKVKRISRYVAELFNSVGLDKFDGKIFVFTDGDVLALYQKDPEQEDEMMRNLRTEFTQNNLIHLMIRDDLAKRMSQINILSRTKLETAVEFAQKETIVAMVEDIEDWRKPDNAIIDSIQKRRKLRHESCILIIEDDHLVRQLLYNILKEEHRVVQAVDAKTGILQYANHSPNIVFLDINMPGLDGHETLKRIKSLDPQAYVVMVSGLSSEDNVLNTYSNGAAGFVCKPFSKEKLRNYITDCPSLVSKALAQAVINH